MPRSAQASIQNNFVRGLITEATGLNFPENACTDTFNCVFERDGSIRRRFGIDYEDSYSEQSVTRDDVVINSYYWRSAAGDGNNTLAVLQAGETLYFYKVGSGALSSDMIDTIDLTSFSPSGAPSPGVDECQFASGNGYLFVSHPSLEPFYVEFDPVADSVLGVAITVKIRDFEGVDDGLEVDERPSTLSNEHEYNLNNQGWYAKAFASTGKYDPQQNVLEAWDDQRSDFPGNNDVWYLYIAADADPPPAESFRPGREGYTHGNTPAPKGHFILDAFYKDRSSVSNISGLDVESAGYYRPSTIAFFSGRVWYSGVKGQDYSNRIYFSQIIEEKKQLGYCYQLNDPTDRDTFDLLASDGGVITIPEAGTIIKLWPIGNSLLVFASNGIWGITGSEGLGFRANDYSVSKLSSIGAITASSFVSIDGSPAWWTQEDIYIASGQDISGNVQVTPLVESTIREFFDEIPAVNKRYVKGAYNSRTRVVHWLYRSSSFSNLAEAYAFDRVLNFNTSTQAFYPWSIDNSPVSMNGVLVVEGEGSVQSLVDVTDTSLNVVTDSSLNDVQVLQTTLVSLSAVTKFIASYDDGGSYNLTFAEESDSDYLDWFTHDSTGVDFLSYLESGYSLHADAQRKYQPTYVYIFNETGGEQCQLDFSSRWGYATSGNTGRWSSVQRLIFPNDNYEYQFKRIKTRGHGLVLQFYIASVSGEPFRMIGWSVFETQNQNI